MASSVSRKIQIPSNIGFSTLISADGENVGVLFDNLQVSVNPIVGVTNLSAHDSKNCTLYFPYTTDKRSIKMIMDIKGYCTVDSGAIIRAIVCAGDATTVLDLTAKSGDAGKASDLKNNEVEFANRVEFTMQNHSAKPNCIITFFLLAERDSDVVGSAGASLVVDGFDLSFAETDSGSFHV